MKRGSVKRNGKAKVKRKPIATLDKPRLKAASGGRGGHGWGGGSSGPSPSSPDSRRCIGGY